MLSTAAGDASSGLDDLSTVVDIIGTLVTAIAVVVGAVWAYFKFVKDRTYRPRLEVGMFAERLEAGGSPLLLARVTVKNIGNSDVHLLQQGTGLRVSRFAGAQPGSPAPAVWSSLRVYEIFKEHEWIEPGETVSDDVLIHTSGSNDCPLLFQTRFVWSWPGDQGNIVVCARQVFPVPPASPDPSGVAIKRDDLSMGE